MRREKLILVKRQQVLYPQYYGMDTTIRYMIPLWTGRVQKNTVKSREVTLSQLQAKKNKKKSVHNRKGMSDYDRVLTEYNYLRSNCSYAYKGWQYNYANTAWGALVYGEAQCSGYARAMKALCDAIGVDCRYVHADSKASNPSHQWNQVRVGGKWYILDAQSGGFLLGSRTWKKKAGMSWDTKGLPTCSVTDYKK